MKQYLYEVVLEYGKNDALGTGLPMMPKVLAEKTARDMRRAMGGIYGKNWAKAVARKAHNWKLVDRDEGILKRIGITTKDGTPHNLKNYGEYPKRRRP